MTKLKSLWEKTKKKHDTIEKSLALNYIRFLRKVAATYANQGRKVYFKENRVVHWGEGAFGYLIIEGTEDVYDVLGEYIPEIRFEKKLSKAVIKNYEKIKKDTLNKIRYTL